MTPPGTSSKPAVNGTVGAAIIVDPFDPRTVWLGTGGENDEIWRSDDCGATWTRVNTGPGSVGDNARRTAASATERSGACKPIPSPAACSTRCPATAPRACGRRRTAAYSWTDVLAGTEYDSHADYRFVNNVSLDPTDHLHVVVSTHGACSAPYDP